MTDRLGPEDILQRIEADAVKLEALCSEFQNLLTEDQLEECSVLDFGPNADESYTVDSDGIPSSDEEFLSTYDRNLIENSSSAMSSLTSSTSSTSSSSTNGRSYPSPLSSRHSQVSDHDNNPTALTAISLAKVLLTGTIPRLNHIINQYLENPSGTGPGIDEIRVKYETFQTVTTEAYRRFSILRQTQDSQHNPNGNEP